MGLTGTAINSPVTVTEGVNDKIIVQYDSSTRTLTVPAGTYNDATELAAAMQTAIDTSFGSGKLNVTADVNGALQFDPVAKAGYLPQVVVKESTLSFADIGLVNGQSYRLNLNAKLSEMADKFNTPLDGSASYQFTVNGKTIDFTGDDTISSIMTKVNQSGAGVTMSYDSTNDQFVFKNRSTGASSQVNLTSVSGNFLDAIGVGDQSVSGQDAEFTIDGVQQSNSSNQFSLDGISYTLNKASQTDITISLTNDPDAIVDKLKDFVAAYNDMIDLVNRRLSETRSRGYEPLLDEEKSELKDSDIALWEAEAKKGLLRNSDLLRDIKSGTRELFVKQVDGIDTYNVLSSIGITTLPYVQGNPQDSGKLQINEAKLKEAIAANPEAVNQLLTNNTGVESREGLMVTMYNRVNAAVTNLNAKAGRSTSASIDVTNELGRRMYDLQQKVSDMEKKLSKKEDYYYQRFSVIDTAIAKSNSTMDWLSKQFV
jgi:flagellar hook-associated protein 2